MTNTRIRGESQEKQLSDSKQTKRNGPSHTPTYNPSNPLRSPAGGGAVFQVMQLRQQQQSPPSTEVLQRSRAAVPDLSDGVSVVLLDGALRQTAAAAQQVPVQLHRAAHQLRLRQRGHGQARPRLCNTQQTTTASALLTTRE